MKKLLGVLCSVTLVLACTFTLFGCKEKTKSTVMNVSLNPEVEFILDKDNKVVSVNALNEEGNLVINGQVFVGKSSDEAVKLFVQVSKDTGFLVTGSVSDGQNEINISLSGDAKKAKEIYNSAKETVDSYLKESGITASIKKASDLTKEYLQEQVKECEKYLSDSEIKNMSYEQLLETLKQSREETKEYVSQELKEAYYQAKNNAYIQAKLEYAKSQMNVISQGVFDVVLQTYQGACTELENARQRYFVSEDSFYQKALATLRENKVEYLNYLNYVAGLAESQITTTVSTTLDNLKTLLDSAEQSLNSVYESCLQSIKATETALTTAYTSVMNTLQQLGVDLSKMGKELTTNVETAINQFKSSFVSTYQTSINKAKTDWNNMKAQLEAGYNA